MSLIGVLSDTTNQLDAIDIDSINAVLTELAGATERNVDVVPQLLDDLSAVSAAVSAREQELTDLVDSANVLADTLADRDQEILQLIDAATVLLDRLHERRDELATILGEGSDAVRTLTDSITAHRASIDALLTDVHVLLEGVSRNTESINTSLAYSGPVFTLLSNVLAPEGGFNVAVEGIVGTADQVAALFDLLIPGDQTP